MFIIACLGLAILVWSAVTLIDILGKCCKFLGLGETPGDEKARSNLKAVDTATPDKKPSETSTSSSGRVDTTQIIIIKKSVG
jgi:hypothetical protein